MCRVISTADRGIDRFRNRLLRGPCSHTAIISNMALAMEDPTDCSHCPKGKSKASLPEPTESTPLLQFEGDSSQSSRTSDNPLDPESAVVRQRLCSTLTFVFFTSLFFCLLAFVAIILIVYSFASRLSDVSPQDLLENGLQFQGPNRIDVLNVTNGGIWINVDARVGIDAGSILGVNSEGNEGSLKDAWNSIGRLGIRLMGTMSADVSEVYIYSIQQALLATVSVQPIELPVTANPPHDASWLTPVSIPFFVQPTNSSSDLAQFVDDVWRNGSVSVRTLVSAVTVWGGQLNRKNWRSILSLTMENLETQVRAKRRSTDFDYVPLLITTIKCHLSLAYRPLEMARRYRRFPSSFPFRASILPLLPKESP